MSKSTTKRNAHRLAASIRCVQIYTRFSGVVIDFTRFRVVHISSACDGKDCILLLLLLLLGLWIFDISVPCFMILKWRTPIGREPSCRNLMNLDQNPQAVRLFLFLVLCQFSALCNSMIVTHFYNNNNVTNIAYTKNI